MPSPATGITASVIAFTGLKLRDVAVERVCCPLDGGSIAGGELLERGLPRPSSDAPERVAADALAEQRLADHRQRIAWRRRQWSVSPDREVSFREIAIKPAAAARRRLSAAMIISDSFVIADWTDPGTSATRSLRVR